MNALLERQIARLKRRYPDEKEFQEKLLEVISDSYEDFERQQKLKNRTMKLMSEELLELNKATEEKNQAFISTILDKIVDGVITLDQHGKILSVNKSAEYILDEHENGLLNQGFTELLGIYNSFEVFLDVYKTGVAQKMENQIGVMLRSQEREEIPCELSISEFSRDDLFLYIVIFRDSSQRMRFEQDLIIAKEKVEEAAIAKADFLSTMSHEIRTPMNSVIGMTNLLLKENLSRSQEKYVNILKFSSEHLLSIINDILDFNKIEAGKIEFEMIDFNLHKLVEGIKESNFYRAQEKGVKLKVFWDVELPRMVIGDPSRLAQILTNLVSNAVKFTEKGHIYIHVSLEEKGKKETTIEFKVEDTGIGIPKDQQAQIFESFSQSGKHTTRKYGGTGLGLAISKKLLELQQSQIKLKSKPKHGSVFSFSLRFTNSQLEEEVSDKIKELYDEPDKSLHGCSILLVEDNPMNQMMAGQFLKNWKCEFQIASDGEAALELAESMDFDLILMDLQMPRMNGYDTTKAIRKISRHQNTPIIALTASAVLEVKEKALIAGMNDFVSKPFNPSELFQKITKNIKLPSY